jgi:hypothetical protein
MQQSLRAHTHRGERQSPSSHILARSLFFSLFVLLSSVLLISPPLLFVNALFSRLSSARRPESRTVWRLRLHSATSSTDIHDQGRSIYLCAVRRRRWEEGGKKVGRRWEEGVKGGKRRSFQV